MHQSPHVLNSSAIDTPNRWFRENLVDVAYGKTADQSSYSKWSDPDEACLALFGITDKDFTFHTDLEPHPWWMVDLGFAYPIEFITIYNRRGLFDRAKNIQVETSLDKVSWRCIHSGIAYFTDRSPLVASLGSEIVARYVRLSLPEGGYLHLSRVHVLVKMEHFASSEMTITFPPSKSPSVSPVRVAILGTSNSIAHDGYAAHLKQIRNVSVVANASLGSSHAAMAAFRLPVLQDVDFDVLIVDLAANEAGALSVGLYDLSATTVMLENVLVWCAAKRVIPVFLVLPFCKPAQSGTTSFETSCPVEDHYRTICEAHGVPWFNGYEFTRALARSWKRPIQLLFKDAYHLCEAAQRGLANALAQTLEELRCSATIEVHQRSVPTIKFFSPVEMKAPPDSITRLRSSIIETDVMTLCEGEQIQIELPKGSKIIGVAFDMVKSNGALRWQNELSVKRLDSAPGISVPVCIVAWNMLKAIQVTTPRLTLECVECGSSPNAEFNEHNAFDIPTQGNASIALCGFVVCLGETVKEMISVDYRTLDLLNTLDGKVIVHGHAVPLALYGTSQNIIR